MKMLCVTHVGKFVMQATLWIEKMETSSEVFGHISGLLLHHKRVDKMKVDVQKKFLRVIEDLAWINGCTTLLFSTRVMTIEQFEKYGY